MGEHDFVYSHESAEDHVFACSKCGLELGFNKPGLGSPNADTSGPVPLPPPTANEYVPPCEA